MRMVAAIKKALVSLIKEDTTPYPQVQVEYNGITVDAYRMSVYGVSSQPPLDALAAVLSPDCRSDDPIALIDDPANRFDQLQEGEVQVGNYLTKTSIKFAANKDMALTVASDGDYVLDVLGGGVRITSNGAVEVTAPTVNVTGDVVVTGNLAVSGTITGTVDVIGGPASTSLASHTHTISGGSSAGTTTPPNP